jgi:hypothetical protein
VRIIPETANRDDWPRLVAQTVNALVRRPTGVSGLTLELDGGDADLGNDASVEIDGGDA